MAVPIVTFDTSIFLGAGETWDGNEFALMFDNHGFDGNPATTDNLGRFCIYVEAPEPATLGLLALGGLTLLRRRYSA
ncbi:MAG: PEP-CTERM sorting domain-containing protein [Phycisphaerales bacterium]|nr:PEP-CTERM sorting domain-containing protein [Phycisphaerales bacterium]